MIEIVLNKLTKEGKDFPKSLPSRITEKYLKGGKLEYFNKAEICFDDDFQNQYVAALHAAFGTHRNFVINPDDIWLLITQGLSIHINKNSEKYRETIVDFSGKKTIKIQHDGLIMGSPDNTWEIVFPEFQKAITSLIKDPNIANTIVSKFSTTTLTDTTCLQIALMDITKSYFSYVVETRCGIPTIFVDGTKEDWVKISDSINYLLPLFDMQDWATELNIIIGKIIDTYNGIIDKDFFNSIYKYSSGSGGDSVTGWINDFFPYIVERRTENIIKKVLSSSMRNGPCLQTSNFPSSISSVPFIWEYYGEKYDMNFFAGFCGLEETENGIRPKKNFFIGHSTDVVLKTSYRKPEEKETLMELNDRLTKVRKMLTK
jgi:hypothetical protein